MADLEPVGADARSWLRREHNSVRVYVETHSLNPGHAYSVWLVAFNRPQHCGTPYQCAVSDLPVFADHDARAESSIVGVTGAVVGADGTATFVGTVYEALLGNNGSEVLFGPGLTDARGAEVHLMIRDHGPASGDLIKLFESISSYAGNCYVDGENECVDQQVAVHRAERRWRRH